MLRSLYREFRSFPVTMSICTLWVVVYVLIVAAAAAHGTPLTSRAILLGTGGEYRFGSMSLHALEQGEFWRAITSTFVHYGIIHLAMNLFGMYQLGCLVESWYGRGQFLAIYVAIGTGGNLLSGLFRYETGADARINSAGGSTVVLGLVALCAVVGWRSKTRMGDYLRSQMVKVLILTALLGLMPRIDNWGHAGGALVGALIGFGHRFLHRNLGQASARWAGAISALFLFACGAALFLDHRVELRANQAKLRLDTRDRTLANLALVERCYWKSVIPRLGPHGYVIPKDSLGALNQALAALEVERSSFDQRNTRRDYRRLKEIVRAARTAPPSEADLREFRIVLNRLARQAVQDRDTARNEFLAISASGRVR
jgi:membrane associated rhomboid family serine protease